MIELCMAKPHRKRRRSLPRLPSKAQPLQAEVRHLPRRTAQPVRAARLVRCGVDEGEADGRNGQKELRMDGRRNVGLVREICDRIKAESGVPMKVISTGGLAPLFQQTADLFDAYEDDLTMQGLRRIHEHNKDIGTHA